MGSSHSAAFSRPAASLCALSMLSLLSLFQSTMRGEKRRRYSIIKLYLLISFTVKVTGIKLANRCSKGIASRCSRQNVEGFELNSRSHHTRDAMLVATSARFGRKWSPYYYDDEENNDNKRESGPRLETKSTLQPLLYREKPKPVLVVGATGEVGRRVVLQLLKQVCCIFEVSNHLCILQVIFRKTKNSVKLLMLHF